MDTVPLTTKRCSTCRADLPLTTFHKRARSIDGLQANCKECAKAATTAWWKKEGGDTHRAYHVAWRESHPGAAAKNGRAHYWRNPAKQIQRVLLYRAANRDRLRAYNREWMRLNRKNTEYGRRRKARERGGIVIPFTSVQLAAKVAYWGWQCWVCGGAWQAIDHVKPLSKGGPHVLANLRPICTSCNSHKSARWPLPPR